MRAHVRSNKGAVEALMACILKWKKMAIAEFAISAKKYSIKSDPAFGVVHLAFNANPAPFHPNDSCANGVCLKNGYSLNAW